MWKIEPIENPDRAFARNKQVILKKTFGEYSTSVYTAPFKVLDASFYGGNRDYSWQGLLVGPIDGQVYKMIDAVYFSFPNVGMLRAKEVLYDPEECIFRYECGEDILEIKYTLMELDNNLVLKVSTDRPCWFTVPLDFRRGDDWSYATYSIVYNLLDKEGRMEISSPTTPLTLHLKGFKSFRFLNMNLEWIYKLGDGFRRLIDGEASFIQHRRSLYLPAMFYSPNGKLEASVPLPVTTIFRPKLDIDSKLAKLKLSDGVITEALRLRLRTLSKFSIIVDGRWFPEAGAWWFRKPWVRDCLEGVRWNIETYVSLFKCGDRLHSLIEYLLNLAKSMEGLPTIVGCKDFSSDALPQLFYVGCMVSRKLNDRSLLLKVLDVVETSSQKLLSGKSLSNTKLVDSILCCPASSSWIDTVFEAQGKRWPTRLPYAWIEEGIDPSSRDYALLEVNALYLEALKEIASTCRALEVKVTENMEDLYSTLLQGFRKYFKTEEAWPPLTTSPVHGLVDRTLSSSAVLALATLYGTLYSYEDLYKLWTEVSNRLLVYRKLMVLGSEEAPFGILVRDVEKAPFLNDREYHGPTIWPKETPHLIKLMELLNIDPLSVLINNLDHMVSEGALGYCSEFFSLPLGGNVYRSHESRNPLPMKNPAQYWSHWCDPYLANLSKLMEYQRCLKPS